MKRKYSEPQFREQYYKLEGPMQKKGQGLTGKFQKRYFRLMLQGKVLVYYKEKPKSLYDKPKGIFEMIMVQGVTVK